MPLRFYNTLSQRVEEFQPARDNTVTYTTAFLEDRVTLRLGRPERLVPATGHIEDMVGAIERLGQIPISLAGLARFQ
jgi:cysteinyl-tRNA synthetase